MAGEHSENKSREHTEIKTVKDIKFCTNFYNKGDKISQPPSSKQIEQKNRKTIENYYKTIKLLQNYYKTNKMGQKDKSIS